MATRTLVTSATYDNTLGHFAFFEASGQTYMRIGALRPEDVDLMQSLLQGSAVLFYQNNVFIRLVRITDDYDNARGLPIASTPPLTLNDSYTIRFTQARPGEDGTGTGGEPTDPTDPPQDGEDGEDGEDGYTPILAIVADGERRVAQIVRYEQGNPQP